MHSQGGKVLERKPGPWLAVVSGYGALRCDLSDSTMADSDACIRVINERLTALRSVRRHALVIHTVKIFIYLITDSDRPIIQLCE